MLETCRQGCSALEDAIPYQRECSGSISPLLILIFWSCPPSSCALPTAESNHRRLLRKRAITKPFKMAQPTPQPGPPRVRECTACGETFTSKHNDPDLIKPCSVCASDYCYDCLDSLFRNAAYQPGAMLPRCCALIQIHTIIARLDSDTANAYRAKLAERIIPDKFYCPAPSCSAFIHEKHVPLHQPSSSRTSAKRVFLEILDQMNLSPAARFFRTSELQASLPDYYSKVQEHTDLNMIRKKVDSDR